MQCRQYTAFALKQCIFFPGFDRIDVELLDYDILIIAQTFGQLNAPLAAVADFFDKPIVIGKGCRRAAVFIPMQRMKFRFMFMFVAQLA